MERYPIRSRDALPDGDFEALDHFPIGEVAREYLTTCHSSPDTAVAHPVDEVDHSTISQRELLVRITAVHEVEESARHGGKLPR